MLVLNRASVPLPCSWQQTVPCVPVGPDRAFCCWNRPAQSAHELSACLCRSKGAVPLVIRNLRQCAGTMPSSDSHVSSSSQQKPTGQRCCLGLTYF